MQAPAYMQQHIQAVILETEKKVLQLSFTLPEVLPETIDETNKLLDIVKNKKYLSTTSEFNGMSDIVESIKIDLSNAEGCLMEHLESLELPLHSSWLDDLNKMERFIFCDDEAPVGVYEIPDEYADDYDDYNLDITNERATILPTHPCYNLAQTSDGEINMKAIKSFIEESYDLAIAQGEDGDKLLNDLIQAGFESYYASKKMKELLEHGR